MTEHSIQHGPIAASATEADGAQGLRDQLMAELCGLGATMTAAMVAQPGFVPCEHAFGMVIEGLEAAVSSSDESCLSEVAEDVRARSEHVSAHRGVPMGTAQMPAPATPEAALLLAALRGIAADAACAMRLGRMDQDVDVFLVNALTALGAGDASHALLERAGQAALAASRLARQA
ncbi:hypothetical protein [Paratractidigestivibacter faecalis]|uniref:hypothetical protein n=1 Tax=Paratractidigestivibacter faecalis TaxID=2292441 RepID=UPI000E3BB729|nr:hypothetical protein [Paratractidigestivibacter faecalis]